MAFASIAFCENLKELMKKPGLTLEKLSEKSGVSVSLLSRYSNQTTSTPSLSSLISIARGLDVGIDELLKGGEGRATATAVIPKLYIDVMGKLEICAVQPHLLIQNDLILSKEKVQENSVVVGKVAMTIRNI